MVMDIDKARGDGRAARLDHSDTPAWGNAPDIFYEIAGYPHVRNTAWIAKPIEDEIGWEKMWEGYKKELGLPKIVMIPKDAKI